MGFHADSQRGPGAGVRMSGPLAPFTGEFRRELADRGYTLRSITDQLRLAARLSRWLEGQGLTAEQVTVPVAGEFFQARRTQGHRKWLTPRSLSWLPACLPVAPVPDSAAGDAPVDALLAAYRGYLLAERGLAAGTVTHYLRFAGEFLEWLPGPLAARLAGLSAGQITTFVIAWCPRRSPAQAKLMATALRSLLRFLHVTGQVRVPLAGAVPAVPGWRRVSLPQTVSAGQVTRMLAGCDRDSDLGRRDYAVILLMSRLALRAAEVAAVQVSDVDWRAGLLMVRGKGKRRDLLPLPADVGEAMAGYLQHGRPRAPGRPQLFLCAVAPFGPLHSSTVSGIVLRACRRAGLVQFGPHRLRHAVACSLLAEGASLEEIGQLLRHAGQTTTAVYAKVDLARLAGLALPCPIGAIR